MKLFQFDGRRIGIERAGNAYDITDALGIDPMAVLGPLKSGRVRPLAVT